MIEVRIWVAGDRLPLPGCNITIFVHSTTDQQIEEIDLVADDTGYASYNISDGWIVDCLQATPVSGFWATRVDGPLIDAHVVCPRLPESGPLGWWHQVMGRECFDPSAAHGIRVGVVDSGLAPHKALGHAIGIGAFLGRGQAGGLNDETSHGTHVAGLIGARPVDEGDYGGIAPAATLLIARAIDETGHANNLDIAEAISALATDHEADLINLSLGHEKPSRAVFDAILEAAENGCLCFAAAGNDFGPVVYPAAFDEVVAIAACGLIDWPPRDSLAASFVPSMPTEIGSNGLYCASFSGRGHQIDAIAPGVGLISTVPAKKMYSAGYAAMSGTSMASPLACGALACKLASDPAYLSMPRDAARTRAARDILVSSLRSIGLSQDLQGGGIPTI